VARSGPSAQPLQRGVAGHPGLPFADARAIACVTRRSFLGRHMARWLYPFTISVLVALWGQPAAADSPTPEEIISSSLTRCEARIQAHLVQADSTRRTANVLLIIGAAIAALGNALAPFLKKAPHRKFMAVLGALGAYFKIKR
jgi:hypothetical protein